MPYLLPADPDVTDLACVPVFYPDAPEYRRALTGQIMELGDKWNWEGSGADQQVAVDSWNLAIAEFLECVEMGYCENLDAKLDLILDGLDSAFCSTSYYIQLNDYTIYVTGQDDLYPDSPYTAPLPPTTDGTDEDSSGTTTEAEFRRYLCRAGRYLVDVAVDILRYTKFSLQGLFLFGGIAAEVALWIVNKLISPAGPAEYILWTLEELAAFIDHTYQDWTLVQLDTAIADLQAEKEAIACSIKNSDTYTEAAQAFRDHITAIVSPTSLATFLVAGPWTALAALIWNGLFDTGWANCACGSQYQLYDVQAGSYIESNMIAGDEYEVPSESIGSGFGRARFQIHDGSGTRINVDLRVRTIGYCNGGTAVSTPYYNATQVRDAADVDAYFAHPGVSFDDEFSLVNEGIATSNTYSSCSGFKLGVTLAP